MKNTFKRLEFLSFNTKNNKKPYKQSLFGGESTKR